MKTSNTDAASLRYAFGVKNSPSANIFNASSKLINTTKPYSAIWKKN